MRDFVNTYAQNASTPSQSWFTSSRAGVSDPHPFALANDSNPAGTGTGEMQ